MKKAVLSAIGLAAMATCIWAHGLDEEKPSGNVRSFSIRSYRLVLESGKIERGPMTGVQQTSQYDPDGRLVESIIALDNGQSFRTTYSFDGGGNPTGWISYNADGSVDQRTVCVSTADGR